MPARGAPAADSQIGDSHGLRVAALALLARRDYSSGELRKRLKSKGFDPALIEDALRGLASEHALDDARYAENYVFYHARRGHGPVRIAADLKARGLPGELVSAALDSGPDWVGLARRERERKFGPGAPGSFSEKARQARFLQYRGFSADHIRSALGSDLTSEA